MTLVEFLLAQLDEDERTAQADERHWSEVPSHLFSAQRALADVVAKRAAVNALARCTDHRWTGTWAVVTVARDALKQLAVPHAEHPDYRSEWAP